MVMIKDYFRLLRVKHYIKNILIFTTIVYGAQTFTNNFFKVFVGYISFCLMSSCIYILNDIVDYNIDKKTKTKKNEPIASGRISKKKGIIIALIAFILSIIINYFTFSISSYYYLIGYFLLNIVYSFFGKRIPYFELLLMTIFYLLRVFYGASILSVNVSIILILTVMFGSLYIVLMKRIIEIKNKKYRKVFEKYNKNILRILSIICLLMTIVIYFIWTIIEKIPILLITNVLIIMIFIRYDKKVNKSPDGNPIEIVFKDKIILILCLIYGIISTIALEIYL